MWYNNTGDKMKKKLLLVIAVLFLVTGCNKYKKLECSYSDKNNNMSVNMTQKYYFSKDKKNVKKVNIVIKYSFSENYVSSLKKNNIDIKDVINTDSICESYKSNDDSKCKIDIKDNGITIDINNTYSGKKSITGDYKFYKKYFEGMKYECK